MLQGHGPFPWSHRESNSDLIFRRDLFYPLNYETPLHAIVYAKLLPTSAEKACFQFAECSYILCKGTIIWRKTKWKRGKTMLLLSIQRTWQSLGAESTSKCKKNWYSDKTVSFEEECLILLLLIDSSLLVNKS